MPTLPAPDQFAMYCVIAMGVAISTALIVIWKQLVLPLKDTFIEDRKASSAALSALVPAYESIKLKVDSVHEDVGEMKQSIEHVRDDLNHLKDGAGCLVIHSEPAKPKRKPGNGSGSISH